MKNEEFMVKTSERLSTIEAEIKHLRLNLPTLKTSVSNHNDIRILYDKIKTNRWVFVISISLLISLLTAKTFGIF